MKLLFYKLKEALISIFPITMIVVLLNLTPLVAFNTKETIVFIISALFFSIRNRFIQPWSGPCNDSYGNTCWFRTY